MGEVRTELERCNFTDADEYSGIDEFLLGANAVDAQNPGPPLTVTLNGATNLAYIHAGQLRAAPGRELAVRA